MKKSKTPTQGLGTTPAVPLLVLAVFLSAKPTQENPLTAAEIAEKIQEKIPNFAVKGKLIVEAVKRLQLFLDLTKFDLEIESSTHGYWVQAYPFDQEISAWLIDAIFSEGLLGKRDTEEIMSTLRPFMHPEGEKLSASIYKRKSSEEDPLLKSRFQLLMDLSQNIQQKNVLWIWIKGINENKPASNQYYPLGIVHERGEYFLLCLWLWIRGEEPILNEKGFDLFLDLAKQNPDIKVFSLNDIAKIQKVPPLEKSKYNQKQRQFIEKAIMKFRMDDFLSKSGALFSGERYSVGKNFDQTTPTATLEADVDAYSQDLAESLYRQGLVLKDKTYPSPAGERKLRIQVEGASESLWRFAFEASSSPLFQVIGPADFLLRYTARLKALDALYRKKS